MNTGVPSLKIEVDEWPQRDDLLEFLHTPNAKQDIHAFLTEEFDTIISFRIGELDLLSGYKEAFILPLHAFVRSLSQGLKALAAQESVDVPIYLQQHAVSPGSPAHTLQLTLKDEQLEMTFTWGGQNDPPAQFDELSTFSLDPTDTQKEIAQLVDTYARTVARLLGHLHDWSGDDISALFESF